jgi:hypothetical protein
MSFNVRFPSAHHKVGADLELECEEGLADRRRATPRLDGVVPGRSLRDRFAAWLAARGLAADTDPPEFFDLSFFFAHKHLGTREITKGDLALLCTKERLKRQLVASAAERARTLSGEAQLRRLIDELLSTTTGGADSRDQQRMLRELADRGVSLGPPYAFVTPLVDGLDAAAVINQATTWPCRLGLGVRQQQMPFVLLTIPVGSLDPASPTAFDAGMAHLEGAWIPGGVTQAENHCRKRFCSDGLRELFIKSPRLDAITSIGEFVSCVPNAV